MTKAALKNSHCHNIKNTQQLKILTESLNIHPNTRLLPVITEHQTMSLKRYLWYNVNLFEGPPYSLTVHLVPLVSTCMKKYLI